MTMHEISEWIGHEIDHALDVLEGPHDTENILNPHDIGEVS